MKRSFTRALVLTIALLAAARDAAAEEPAPETTSPGDTTEKDKQESKPAEDPQREVSVEPKPALPPAVKTRFDADPILDGAIIGVALGTTGILGLIIGTGEIRPQQVPQSFDRNNLLGIDRGALSQTVDTNASTFSNIGLYTAIGFAVLDPVLSGLREDSVQAGLVDGIIYAESIALSSALTNLTKVAVRRPRPAAYIEAEAHKNDPSYVNPDTDSALSFYSGHAAVTATIGATATYLAFARSKGGVRPWVTLILATALTSFTSYERVRAGVHFPTDVIAGTIAGAGVGIIVPHLHRSEDIKQRRMWVGCTRVERGDGGVVQLSGFF